MSIIKLQNEGDTLTGVLTGCEQAKGNFGEQVKFTFNTGDILYLPKDSADRQLDRLGLDYGTAVGENLTFSRDRNPKPGAKPFWGISPTKPAQPASKRVAPPSGAPPQAHGKQSLPFDEPTRAERAQGGPMPGPLVGDPVEEIAEVLGISPLDAKAEGERVQRSALEAEYRALYERCAAAQNALGSSHQMPFDGASVNAMTSTIFISWKERGLLTCLLSDALKRAAEGAE